MSVRIRLKRIGKKHKPIYNIVVADSRFPRNGKFIEKIGTYNPNTNPPFSILKIDKSIYWLMKGAKPTLTVRSILSKNGILLRKHLLEGVKKGAFSNEDYKRKISEWMNKNKINNYNM